MKLIIGLGNPNAQYQKTRHNVGFLVLDDLAAALELKFKVTKKFKSEIAAGNGVILAKPRTYMNSSGEAAAALLAFYKLTLKDLLVIHDEIDLPLGRYRLFQGGAAGHRGVESIIAAVGSEFNRLRIGIENRKIYRVPDTENYVLQNFTSEENEKLKKIIPRALKEIAKFIN